MNYEKYRLFLFMFIIVYHFRISKNTVSIDSVLKTQYLKVHKSAPECARICFYLRSNPAKKT